MTPARRCGAGVAALAAAALLALAPMAYAAAPGPDADGDGIADAVDDCPDTLEGDFVGADGCTVCGCDAHADGSPWASHKAFVACVATNARALLAPRAARLAVRSARHSSCGNDDLVRCCVFANDDAEVGICRIMTGDACDALDDRTDTAWDFDTGSCLPNPCNLF